MPDTTVRVEYIGAVQNFSEVTITGNQQVWRIGSSAFVETGRASQLVASGKFRSYRGAVAVSGESDGAGGTGMTYTVRNLDNATVTRIMLPSAPAELMLNWWDSTGSSGNLRYVLEAASANDATARLNDDTAHGELVANGNPVIVKFEPTMFPVYIYVRASSAVGAGSNILSMIAKVTS